MAHEAMEQHEHVEHAAHSNKQIALLISVLALFLAFSEVLGKSAQTEGLTLNIHASDTWNFFQAKTIRQTAIRTAAEGMVVEASRTVDAAAKTAMTKQIDTWQKTATRYESDPEQKDGRKELREKAEEYEHERDLALARYHHYEVASAAFQIGIVLASAGVITSIVLLPWLAGGMGVIGLIFAAIGLFAPNLVHFV